SDTQNQIYNTASTAINETYQKLFGNKTSYSGPSVLGFDNDYIVFQLLKNISYIPFYINYNNKKNWCDSTPTKVWKKMIFLQDQDSFSLFGLNNLKVKSVLENKHIATNSPPQCLLQNEKKKLQKSNIIQFPDTLAHIYLSDYIFSEREFNITPFSKNETEIKFWTCAKDPSSNKKTLLNLYNMRLLKTPLVDENESVDKNKSADETKFWKSFNQALTRNIHGNNEMQRILSIIVDEI
ncbi:13744_t:CDS:2, partial [Dentiscutata heterogama]